MSDERDYLGRGLRFPVAVNLTGGLSSSSFEENVRQSVFVILGTAPGERVMRATFGCLIHDLVFAPNNSLTAARAAYFCEEAILKFEPRVSKCSARATPNPVEPNRLDISIEYYIAGSNTARNLVYPFYLRQPDDAPAALGVQR